MTVYCYSRVSTQAQADEGESLRAQQRRVEGYAQMNDMTVNRHFVEHGLGFGAVNGASAGAVLLASLKMGDVVITPKLDRMFRSALDASAVSRCTRSAASLCT